MKCRTVCSAARIGLSLVVLVACAATPPAAAPAPDSPREAATGEVAPQSPATPSDPPVDEEVARDPEPTGQLGHAGGPPTGRGTGRMYSGGDGSPANLRIVYISGGGADEPMIRRLVTEKLPALKTCYVETLNVSPGLSGEVDVELDVDAAGVVTGFSVTSADSSLAACAEPALREVQWPKPSRPSARVKLRVAFRPDARL